MSMPVRALTSIEQSGTCTSILRRRKHSDASSVNAPAGIGSVSAFVKALTGYSNANIDIFGNIILFSFLVKYAD